MLLRQNIKCKRTTKVLDSLAQCILRERPKMGEITAREYVMLLRIILYMDEILEKGLCIMSRAFSSVHGKCTGEEMKRLLIEMLHKKESMKAHKEMFANVFLFYYKHVTKPFYLKKKSYK